MELLKWYTFKSYGACPNKVSNRRQLEGGVEYSYLKLVGYVVETKLVFNSVYFSLLK